MNEYRLSLLVGKQRVDRVANLLRHAGVCVESIESDEVIVSRLAATPADAVSEVRLALLREFKTHFDLNPVVLEEAGDTPAPA